MLDKKEKGLVLLFTVYVPEGIKLGQHGQFNQEVSPQSENTHNLSDPLHGFKLLYRNMVPKKIRNCIGSV